MNKVSCEAIMVVLLNYLTLSESIPIFKTVSEEKVEHSNLKRIWRPKNQIHKHSSFIHVSLIAICLDLADNLKVTNDFVLACHHLAYQIFINNNPLNDRFWYYRCRHCTEFHPIWAELAELVNTRDSKFAIAQVDCTQHLKLCQETDITGMEKSTF